MNGHAFKGACRDLGRMWKSLKKCMGSSRYFEFSMNMEKHIRNCLFTITLNKDFSDGSPV